MALLLLRKVEASLNNHTNMQNLSTFMFRPYTLVIIHLANGETIQGAVQATDENSIRIVGIVLLIDGIFDIYNLYSYQQTFKDFKNDVIEGFGNFYDENGKLCYFGEFKNNKFSGLGTYIYENGLYMSGYWENDILVKPMEMSPELLGKKKEKKSIVSKALKFIRGIL